MDTQEKARITQELESLIKEFRSYKRLYSQSSLTVSQERYLESLRFKLQQRIGKVKNLVVQLTNAQYAAELDYRFDFWAEAVRTGGYGPRTIESTDHCIQACNEAIGKLDELDYRGLQLIKKTLSEEPPKAFIAHGGRSSILDKLREFIEALGIKPIIVELSPSKGMTVDEKVSKYIKDADFGIVLATKGGIIDTKGKETKQLPRLNVIDELERLRAAFPNKTILLLEKGVDLPSNISGLTHEPFVGQSMDRAFTAIARELVEFGILRATKPQE